MKSQAKVHETSANIVGCTFVRDSINCLKQCQGGSAMNWGFVKDNKKMIALAFGFIIVAAGYGIESLLSLESALMGLPSTPAIVLVILAACPLLMAAGDGHKECLQFAITFFITVIALYFAADYVEILLVLIDPSWKMIVPILHDLHFYWGFYFVGATLTLIGAFLPHPKEAEAG
ncbi:MAG: hypothetical protein HQL45_16460 [Alphaproteobacteria bacterium]|nr:hypothetical protein [Alphaproteobacteria bacterium]